MELRDFVSETLKQIIDGVIDAQAYGREKGARVNPLDLPVRNETGGVQSRMYARDVAHSIDFDVAVTTTEGKQTKGGIGVVAGIFALGSQGQSNANGESVSRIKFTIPVVLPTEKTQ